MTETPEAPTLQKPVPSVLDPEFTDWFSDGFFSLDTQLVVTCFNRAAERFLGRNRDDVLGRNLFEAFPEARGSIFEEKYTLALQKKQSLSFETYFGKQPYENWYLVRVFPTRDGISVFFQVTTEQKAVEASLRESEEKFSKIFQSSPAGMVITTLSEGKIIAINNSFMNITGYNHKDYQDRTSMESGFWIRQEDRDKATKMLKEAGSFTAQEFHFRNKSGDIRLAIISAETITIQGDPCIVTTLQDITEIRRAEEETSILEEKLSRAKRMESLGLLAGGVAHDLNNILSGMLTVPELILMEEHLPGEIRENVETIRQSGGRAVAIVDDLLTVSRGIASRKEPVNLNELIVQYLDSPEAMHLTAACPDVQIIPDLDPDLFPVLASAAHIRKSLVNLVMNASQAIEGTGTVVIRTRNRYLNTPLRGYESIPAGEYVVLSVSDNGVGISEEDIDRIFEPFYTRKILGRSGTGLGLTVVWNTVKDHGGAIDIASSKDGTTFTLFLPITRDPFDVLRKQPSLRNLRGHGETVLVVDDEEMQRNITSDLLNRLGYRAEAVSSGEEAIEYLKEKSVDLIVLDMIMDPGIGGRETYERIVQKNPGQKAVITSGFSKTHDVKETQKLGAGAYIQKPFALEKIATAIRETLG